MSWSRCSDWIGATVAVVLVCTLAVGAVGAAPQVQQQEGPTVDDGAEVRSSTSATFVITEPFDDINQNSWTLEVGTNLTDASWTITTKDSSGSEVDTFQSSEAEISSNVAEIEVSVTGTVPEPGSYDYESGKETFVLASFSGGGLGTFTTARAYHYTTGNDGGAGSKEAYEALQAAEQAIADAESAGSGASDAKADFESAKSAYGEEAFQTAKTEAENAESKANDAASGAKLRTYAIYGVVAIVIIGGIGGAFWYRKQQQGPSDPLG